MVLWIGPQSIPLQIIRQAGKISSWPIAFRRPFRTLSASVCLTCPLTAGNPEHPDLATSLENYSALLRETARADEAERMEARAKAIRANSE